MLAIIDKSIKVQGADVTTEVGPCPNASYDAWIARVHANNTPVKAGDTYVWFYVQLLPPRWINCIITVRAGDGT